MKIRDRLMHPKEITQLDVSDEEVIETKKAFDWFMLNQALAGSYAQRAVSAKTTATAEETAKVDANIVRYEAELAKR